MSLRAAALAALLLAGPLPARAFWPFTRRVGPDPIEELRSLAAQGSYQALAARQDAVLSRRDLRRRERRDAYLLFGSSLEQLQKFDKALALYQIATQQFEDDIGLILAQANLYQRVGLDRKARPLFERILRSERNNAQAHRGLARSYRGLGMLERSADHYRQALAGVLEGDAATWTEFGETLAAQRDFPNAEQAARRVLQLSPDAEAWDRLAVYQQWQGRAEQALDSLDKALAIEDAPGRRERRAFWLLQLDRTEEASIEIEGLLRAAPDDALALFARGLLRLRAGRRSEARIDFLSAASRGEGFTAKSAEAFADSLEER